MKIKENEKDNCSSLLKFKNNLSSHFLYSKKKNDFKSVTLILIMDAFKVFIDDRTII